MHVLGHHVFQLNKRLFVEKNYYYEIGLHRVGYSFSKKALQCNFLSSFITDFYNHVCNTLD